MPEDKNADMVTITRLRLEELEADREWLSWLEAAGVDNWEGFSHAQEMRDES
ncbi:RecBCD nuclease inhibitor [Candidatus Wolfebacteria bacterium]|nr:MAG: RecBCD nuclease inhibitor [Candidatus Wolfebacteria bacterium]